jgi:integrase
MTTIPFKDYIAYINKYKKPTPKTLKNYEEAQRYMEVDSVDSENTDAFLTTLLTRVNEGKSHAYAETLLRLCAATLKLNGLKLARSRVYNELVGTIKGKKNVPKHYTDEQIKILLRATMNVSRGFNLTKLLILLFYSGIRISAGQGIRWDSVIEVPESKVVAFKVTSKAHTYYAFMPKHALEEMKMYNITESPYLVEYDPERTKSPFSTYYRSQLAAVIRKRGLQYDVTDGTTIFHSFRKAFLRRLAKDGVESDNISLLAGQIPNTLAYKVYIAEGKKDTPEELIPRLAKAYAKSSFMQEGLLK